MKNIEILNSKQYQSYLKELVGQFAIVTSFSQDIIDIFASYLIQYNDGKFDNSELMETAVLLNKTEFLFFIDDIYIGILNYKHKEYIVSFQDHDLGYFIQGDTISNWPINTFGWVERNPEGFKHFQHMCFQLFSIPITKFEPYNFSF